MIIFHIKISNFSDVYDHVLATNTKQIDTYLPTVTNPASDHFLLLVGIYKVLEVDK